jgi:hypothetical protein
MLILSLNLRGVEGASKKLALKEFLFSVKPDIVFFQETMVDHLRAKHFFLKACPSWNYVAMDSSRLSRGLLLGWNPRVGCLEDFKYELGIFLEGRVSNIPGPVKLLNCYNPYKERAPFWK